MPLFDTDRRAPPMPHGSDRLTFRRLRHPTPLPKSGANRVWGRYLSRLSWLFS